LNTIAKKICLLGEFAVGKTSLVRRFVYNQFSDRYISTIGVKVSRKTIVVPGHGDEVELTMMLWDLAGSQEFDRVRASYLRGAAGAVLVCDLTRADTLDGMQAYADVLRGINPAVRFAVAANKRDLAQERQLSPGDVEAVAAGLSAPWHLTSAKTGDEVETLFRHLGRLLIP